MADTSNVPGSSNPATHTLPEFNIEDIDAADEVEILNLGSNMMLVRTRNTSKSPLPTKFLGAKPCVSRVEEEVISHPLADTPRNRLLYDRENYSIDGKSLYTMLHSDGGRRVVLSDKPYIAVAPTVHESQYRIWVDSEYPVKASPRFSEKILKGIVEVSDSGDATLLEEVYEEVINNRVRREAVRFPLEMKKLPDDRIEIIPEGWLIDGMFLVTWDATIYLYTSDWNTESFDPRSSNKQEEPGEFIGITPNDEFEPYEMTVGDKTYKFGKLEQLFIWRVRWMLDWEHNIEDEALKANIKRTFDEWDSFV